MTDTSYNTTFAPFANWSIRQAPVPQAVHNLPATIAASSSVTTSLIVTEGFSLIAAGITASQNGTLSVQRYLDAAGTVAQGASVSVNLTAATPANLDVMDGKLFASIKLTVTNSAASTSTLSNFALLLQTGDASHSDTGSDGSTTITTGGTAQNLFGGAAPVNGFAIYNPDASNDLWISDTATAAANGTGCMRIAANGGGYETPAGYRPLGPVSIIGTTTGQKISARRW